MPAETHTGPTRRQLEPAAPGARQAEGRGAIPAECDLGEGQGGLWSCPSPPPAEGVTVGVDALAWHALGLTGRSPQSSRLPGCANV